MNDSIETRRAPEPVLQSLNTLLASCRAWDQFQERAHELRRITDNQQQHASERDLSEVETTARVWINTAETAEAAGVFAPSYCFLLRVSAVERIHSRRMDSGFYNADLAGINARMDAIRQREGLNDDEFWPLGKGPEDWEKLEDQYSQVLDAKFEEALREYGLDDTADLYRIDRKSYDARREEGRRLTFEDIPELVQLSALQRQFEAEAEICAHGRAYHAAAIMIGSAIEAALLFTCLNRRDDALKAHNRLPEGERPKNANPKRWRLYELTMVADEAGWLPAFKVADETLVSRPLLDMMRTLRNLAHPARHLFDRKIANVEHEYANARAAYILLKWHLADSYGSYQGLGVKTRKGNFSPPATDPCGHG